MRLERHVAIAHPLGSAAARRRSAVIRVVAIALLSPLLTFVAPKWTSREDRVRTLVRRYAHEAYPQWAQREHERLCPASIAELDPFLGRVKANDAWGTPLALRCGPSAITVVMSAGSDRRFGTRDDITSLD